MIQNIQHLKNCDIRDLVFYKNIKYRVIILEKL